MKHYVGEILEHLCVNELSEVCDSVYAGHRPSAVDENKEFLVVRTSSSVYSHGPFQRASLYIDIYVKNLEGGLEDTLRLQELLDIVDSKFPIAKCDEETGVTRWHAYSPQLVIQGDDNLGFTAWGVRATLLINTTDNYKI